MLASKDPYIKSAYKQLQVISQDEDKRLEYEAREKAIRDLLQYMHEAEERGLERGLKRGLERGLEQGLEQGRYEKTIQIAKKLLEMNTPLSTICEVTGLPAEEVSALQKSS